MRNYQRIRRTSAPDRAIDGEESNVQPSDKADWFEETIHNLKNILHRVFLVFSDFGRLLWNPKKLLVDKAATGENSLRPLVFFALAVPLAIVIMYFDRLLETQLSIQHPLNGRIQTSNLLGASAGHLVEVVNNPDQIVKILLFGFVGGLTLNAVIARITPVKSRSKWQAAILYILGLSLVTTILGIEIIVDAKRLLVWAFPGRIATFLGDPYSLGATSTWLMMSMVIAICSRVVYHALSRDDLVEKLSIAAVVSGLLVYLSIAFLGQIDSARYKLLGDPSVTFSGRLGLAPESLSDLASQVASPLTLTNRSVDSLSIVPGSLVLRVTYESGNNCPAGLTPSPNDIGTSCSVPLEVLNADEKDWIAIGPNETRILRIKVKKPFELIDHKDFGNYRCITVDMQIVNEAAEVDLSFARLAVHKGSSSETNKWCSPENWAPERK